MLNCDMAGVIAAMRGTPKPKAERKHPARKLLYIKPESEQDKQAWNNYLIQTAELNEWRDEL